MTFRTCTIVVAVILAVLLGIKAVGFALFMLSQPNDVANGAGVLLFALLALVVIKAIAVVVNRAQSKNQNQEGENAQ